MTNIIYAYDWYVGHCIGLSNRDRKDHLRQLLTHNCYTVFRRDDVWQKRAGSPMTFKGSMPTDKKLTIIINL